ncbi:DNA-binding protein [Methanolobus sp. ZRKC3]|uniref:NOB1 family endonuclease n=1 Tax=Methanolobus sp. ZRKC3 TaxID=3125786 RepID=UPI00324DD0AA
MVYYIADSAVFIMGKEIDPRQTITVVSVVEELKSKEASLRFDLALEAGVRVEVPDKACRITVLNTASRSRDCEELSSTDIDVLAKALEYKDDSILLTDDYAVQNVASMLGIKVVSVVQKKIRDVIIWEKQCTGCRRKFDSGDDCPVCGSALKKRRKRKI